MLRLVLAGILILSAIAVSAFPVDINELKVNKSLCSDDAVAEYYVYESGRWIKKEELVHWWMCIDVEGVRSDYGSAAKKAIELQNAGKDSPYYGGEWIDPKRGIVFVVVTDEKVTKSYKGKNVVVVKGKYSYRELYRWKREFSKAFSNDTVMRNVWSIVGPDVQRNKVFIGVAVINETILDRIKSLAEKLGVPLDAIVVGKAEVLLPDVAESKEGSVKISVLETKLSRSDKIRPMVGGIKIQSQGTCTLGFVALESVRGFITAGYCGNVNNAVQRNSRETRERTWLGELSRIRLGVQRCIVRRNSVGYLHLQDLQRARSVKALSRFQRNACSERGNVRMQGRDYDWRDVRMD